MDISGPHRMGTVVEIPEIRSTEQAVCELCGDVVTTVNGGRYSGPTFVPILDRLRRPSHGTTPPERLRLARKDRIETGCVKGTSTRPPVVLRYGCNLPQCLENTLRITS